MNWLEKKQWGARRKAEEVESRRRMFDGGSVGVRREAGLGRWLDSRGIAWGSDAHRGRAADKSWGEKEPGEC